MKVTIDTQERHREKHRWYHWFHYRKIHKSREFNPAMKARRTDSRYYYCSICGYEKAVMKFYMSEMKNG